MIPDKRQLRAAKYDFLVRLARYLGLRADGRPHRMLADDVARAMHTHDDGRAVFAGLDWVQENDQQAIKRVMR